MLKRGPTRANPHRLASSCGKPLRRTLRRGFVTRRASVPGGWLVLVQAGESFSLTFLPDGKHRWEEGSPSASKGAKGDKPKVDDASQGTLEKLKADLEKARAMAAAERDKALASHQKAEEELKRLRAEFEKT